MGIKVKYLDGYPDPLTEEERDKVFNTLAYGSKEEQMTCYLKNMYNLRNYTILMVYEEGVKPLLEEVNKEINDSKYTLHTPFYDDRIYCLNHEEAKRGMLIMCYIHPKPYRVKYDIPVTLDTNIVSYIGDFYNKKINKFNIENFIKNIKRTSISCRPYLTENLIKPYLYKDTQSIIKESKKAFESDKIYSTLFAFEKVFPKKSKRKTKRDKYCHTNIMELYDYYKENDYIVTLIHKYKIEYICLLKMIIIQMKHKNKSLDFKMSTFVEFMHKELFSILLPEINLAYEYFKKGSNLLFFGKIQKNRKKTIDDIKNMAWDIFHLRLTIDEFFTLDRKKSDAVMPVFVSYDNNLNEIRKLFQLKVAVVNNITGYTKPVYYINRLNSDLRDKYCSLEASDKRIELAKDKTGLIYVNLINELEKELNEVL